MLLILLQYRWHVFGVIEPSIIIQIKSYLCYTAEFKAKFVAQHNLRPSQNNDSFKRNWTRNHVCTEPQFIFFLHCLIAIKNIKRSSFLHSLIAIKTQNARSAAYLQNNLVFMYNTRVARCTGLYKETTSRRNSAIQFTKMENN